jgi:hypothetical protein
VAWVAISALVVVTTLIVLGYRLLVGLSRRGERAR